MKKITESDLKKPLMLSGKKVRHVYITVLTSEDKKNGRGELVVKAGEKYYFRISDNGHRPYLIKIGDIIAQISYLQHAGKDRVIALSDSAPSGIVEGIFIAPYISDDDVYARPWTKVYEYAQFRKLGINI